MGFDECTDAVCSVHGRCLYAQKELSGCCTEDADCEDADPCTYPLCIGHTCTYVSVVEPCCLTDADCLESSVCMVSWCDPDSHQCQSEPLSIAGQKFMGIECCEAHADCGVGGLWEEDSDADGQPGPDNPSTMDACSGGLCVHVPTPGGCECGLGADGQQCPSDGLSCTDEICFSDCVCIVQEVVPCCVDSADCTDDNVCTLDVCENGVCVHLLGAEGCGTPLDCQQKPCKDVHCINCVCVYEPQQPIGSCCLADDDCEDCDPCTKTYCSPSGCEGYPVDC